MSKKQLKATSTIQRDENDYTEYPKRILIEVTIDPERPDVVLVARTVEGLSGFELYGLIHALLRAVEKQVDFPETQRSDGITVTGKSEPAKGDNQP